MAQSSLTISSINPLGPILSVSEKEGKFSIARESSMLSKINAIFDKMVSQVEHLHLPLSFAETTAEWGKLVPSVEEYSHLGLSHLTMISQPLQVITLAGDVKKAIQAVLVGKELTLKPVEISDLGFSIVMRFCNTLTWLQNTGMITPAAAIAWRFGFIGAFSALMGASFQLGNNVWNYSSFLKLSIAFLNFTASAIAVYLIFQVSTQLYILSLMMTTGTLFLNVVTGTH